MCIGFSFLSIVYYSCAIRLVTVIPLLPLLLAPSIFDGLGIVVHLSYRLENINQCYFGEFYRMAPPYPVIPYATTFCSFPQENKETGEKKMENTSTRRSGERCREKTRRNPSEYFIHKPIQHLLLFVVIAFVYYFSTLMIGNLDNIFSHCFICHYFK